MAKREDAEGVRSDRKPAGGWGSLWATARAVRGQMDLDDASRALLRANKPDGFDCPGCAWPDKEKTSTFQFCENGAKAVTWEATKKRAGPEFFAERTVTALMGLSDHALEDAGRLTHPMAYDRASDRYLPIAWDEAFARIGAALRALPDPAAAEFYASGRTSNEAAFLYHLFAREYGSNNFPDCSNMCHEATSVGLAASIGLGKGTVSLDDFERCDLILSIGHNPGTNHPRMMTTLAAAARRGAKIIAFNPMRERSLRRFADPQNAVEMTTFGSTPIASAFHQVRVGGDGAALTGVMKALVALDAALDRAFIAAHTAGFEAFVERLRAASWPQIEAASGLTRPALEEVARVYAAAKATIVCYGMGVTQHRAGAATVQQIANLLLMKGNFGRSGAGICPLRGHSNVQGARSVGITEKPNARLNGAIERVFGFRPPQGHGHDAVAAMTAIAEGRARAFLSLGGNFAVAMPDPGRTFEAMRRLDLSVFINTKLNRTNLLPGREAILLPCLGRTERDDQASGPQVVTVEDSMSMVHASRGSLPPASPHLRSEPAIVAGIAEATLPASRVPWRDLVADYDRIRDAIEAVLPDFSDYNARIRRPGGFRLPLPATERVWTTASGKAEFRPFAAPADVNGPGVLTLTTVRSHDQYNTTIYGFDDRYRGIRGRRDVLFMNAGDLAALGLATGDAVEVEAERGDRPRRLRLVAVAHDIAPGCAAAYFPETNDLLPLDDCDPASGTPAYKSIPVRVSKAG